MSKRLRPAVELVSAIGSIGFDLQQHSDEAIAAAVSFLRTVNPEMFDWISNLLAAPAAAPAPPDLPDVEVVSAAVHDAWMESKLRQRVTTRRSETGEELMVPYEVLSDAAKQLDRGTVQAVYAAIRSAAPAPAQAEGWQDIATAPKDGTQFVAWNGERAVLIHWQHEMFSDHWCQGAHLLGGACYPGIVTHWMPLPLPPSAPDAETP